MRILFAALLALAIATPVLAGNTELRPHVLFGGSNTDSLEQVSPWIPVQGAKRVILRFWSSKAAFHASTDADSIYTDSIAVFRVAFTDSVTRISPFLSNILAAGDSLVITSTVAANLDTATKMVGVFYPPLHEALRGPGNGSGIVTIVAPVTPTLGTVDAAGYIAPQYMRVYVTPRRRNTVTGGNSTAGKRVVGLKGFRGRALVVYDNR